MDISILPDLITHFHAVAQVAAPLFMEGVETVYNTAANIWTGVTNPDAMPSIERNLQLVKIATAGTGLYFGLMSGNYHAAVACSITSGESLLRLNKAGFTARQMEP